MGNKLGWIIGGAFVVFVGLLILLMTSPTTTPPTEATTGIGKLKLKMPREPITKVLPSIPSGSGDAGDDYEAAINAYKSNLMPVRDICARRDDVTRGTYTLSGDDFARLKPIATLLSNAAGKKEMNFYLRIHPKSIGGLYDANAEAGEFQSLADIPLIVFFSHFHSGGAENYPMAEKAMQDLFAMGWHMMQERARADIVITGCGLQRVACARLSALYKKWNKPERADEVESYAQGLGEVTEAYMTHRDRVVWHLPPHPGDITNLAENHEDRCIRVEAIIGLGVAKITSPEKGDLNRIDELINKYANDPDPIQREAARVARNMTESDYRRLINPEADKRVFN